MKWLKLIPLCAIVLAGFGCSGTQQAASADSPEKIKQLIESRNYVFQVQAVLPMSGRTRQVTGDNYDVTVSKDTINSFLPYFGRAYSAPINPSQGGIQFISQQFEYDEKPGRNGGWDIVIKPKDVQDVQQFSLSVSDNGYASLQVTSTNRQPISYNGVITEKRPRKNKKK
ncbi:DUF4251 domain-containing protein [Chitinophaga sp. GCM10012297]|uniref:DUF4251 domain-containing protein n=1 Tax=Chitinophaga chungangae TaxID=2821488 RepID=A0ABS3YAL1_9BACT|nr:DUF4251 domain-containing protein [Chitinophaga chungangae]MBO9151709.1 DUF4251 domain-containing protein [Chitinophaga chungangae]